MDSIPRSQPHPAGRHPRRFRLFAVGVGVVLALVVVELGLRIRVAFGPPSFEEAVRTAPPRTGEDLRLIDLIRPSSNERLIYELRPGARGRYLGKTVSINAEGMRDDAVSRDKASGTIRVAMLGDSCTFGQGVEGYETFSEQLEAFLNRQFGGPDCRYEVLNFGVPWYNSAMEAEQFRTRVLSGFAPDAVVLFYVGNDLDLPNFILPDSDPWTPRRSFLADTVAERLSRLRGLEALQPKLGPPLVEVDQRIREDSGADASWVPERYRSMVGWNAVVRSLQEMGELGRARSIPMVIFCHNSHVNRFVGRPHDTLRELSSELYRTASSLGWKVADPLELEVTYLEETSQTQKVYWVRPPRDPHPSALLHAILALHTYMTLADSGVLPPVPWDRALPVASQLRLFQMRAALPSEGKPGH